MPYRLGDAEYTHTCGGAATTRHAAFTLIELLTVIAIITLLIGILLPALTASRAVSQAVRCQSNLRQIGVVVRLYVNANRGVVPNATDRSQWVTTTVPNKLTLWTSANAYWGVPYLPYLAPSAAYVTGPEAAGVIATAAQIWRCPSRNVMSPTAANTSPLTPGDYGINFCITGKYKSTFWNKIDRYKNAAGVIFCQDAFEQRLGDNTDYSPNESGNTLSDFGTGLGNLRAWRVGGTLCENYTPGSSLPLNEFYRHRRQCQALCLDGHVATFALSDGADIPASYYWGQTTKPEG